MKINAIDVWTVVVPTIPGRVHSPEWVSETSWDQVPKHIVRLRTDSELVGLGETGRGVPIGEVRAGGSLLLGKDPEIIALQDIYGIGCEDVQRVGTGPAYDAFEMALCDLVGKMRVYRTPCWVVLCATGCELIIGWVSRSLKIRNARWSELSSMALRG